MLTALVLRYGSRPAGGRGSRTVDWKYGAQQHGFLHGGVVTSVLDSACGYAALTTMDLDSAVLTVELKINLIKPAAGNLFRAHGKVVRAGRTLIVCTGEVCVDDDARNIIAVMQATMMAVREREGIKD